mgnify:FL=1
MTHTLGGADEHAESTGGGNDLSRVYLYLELFFLSENHLTLPLFAPILRVISYNEPKGGMGSADL